MKYTIKFKLTWLKFEDKLEYNKMNNLKLSLLINLIKILLTFKFSFLFGFIFLIEFSVYWF